MAESTMKDTIELRGKEKFLSIYENMDYYFDTDYSKQIREVARNEVNSLDFPTSKTEYWKYSRTNRLVNNDYKVQVIEDYNCNIELPEGNRVVIVNGFVDNELSNFHTSGLLVTALSEAKLEHEQIISSYFAKNKPQAEIFASLNTAFHQDGAFIYLPKNYQSKESIHIVLINTHSNVVSQPRNLIIAEDSSYGSLVLREVFENAEASFSNVFNEIYVGNNAYLEVNKIQESESGNFQIHTDQVSLKSDCRFKINSFIKSGDWVRNNLNIQLNGENIETWLNGLYLLKGSQHVDNHTFVDHFKPNCVSHELYKGVLDGRSTAVFNGKVFVHKDAQKTNAYQSNATVLLTDDAKSFSKPELEIYADDVKCSHGSTTGQLDDEGIFYLRSRGVSEEKAKGMMLHAFAGDIIKNIGDSEVAKEIEKFVFEEFGS